MKKEILFDVIIIGAGPIGLTCGIKAKELKLNYLIIDKGCIVNSIFNFPTNMTFFSTSEKIEIGNVPFVAHDVKPTRREALDYYSRVAGAYKLNIKTDEKVIGIKGNFPEFTIDTNKSIYKTKNIIIATGFYDNPNLLNIPGENLEKVKHYFDEPHPYAYKNVAVIGGGNSAVDVALECYRKNAKVTLIVREPELKKSIKYWVRPDIDNRISEGSIKSFFNTSVEEIFPDSLLLNQNGKKFKIKNDYVFAMTGYHPDFDLLRQTGVKIIQNKPKFNKKTHESNVKGIYLAGVICGGYRTDKWFIENSRDHSIAIFNHLVT